MRSSAIILLFHLFACAGIAVGQVPQWQWARSGVGPGAEHATSVAIGPTGNVYVAGHFSSDSIVLGGVVLHNHIAGSYDLFIAAFDPSGDVLWARSFGGAMSERAYGLAVGADGRVHLVVGFESPTIQVGPQLFTNTGSGADILIMTFHEYGMILWATTAGGTLHDQPNAIAVDADANVIVAGKFSSTNIAFGGDTLTSMGSSDVFIVKYGPAGNVLWATRAGGAWTDEAFALAAMPSGDVVVAGYYTQTATFGPHTLPTAAGENIFVVRCFGANGTFSMAKGFAGAATDIALAVDVDDAGNMYLAGYFRSESLVIGTDTLNSSLVDMGFIARLNFAGVPVWAQAINGRSRLQGLAVANWAVYACGGFRNDPLVYAGTSLPLTGVSDPFLLKCDLTGVPQWAAKQTAGGALDDTALALAAGPSGELAMAGTFNGSTLTFGGETLTNSFNHDAYMVKVNDPVVGIMEQSKGPAISIHPNPCTGVFTIEHPDGLNLLRIADMRGMVVHEQQLVGGPVRTVADLSHLAGGCYQVIMSAGQARITGKLMIVH